jgi:hypothetical protein
MKQCSTIHEGMLIERPEIERLIAVTKRGNPVRRDYNH